MSITLQAVEGPADAELISAVRGGDVDAYGLLFERHVEAARRLARQLVASGDVEDLVSDAFMKVLGVLQRGGGPDVAFRAYLLTSVRRLRVDRLRAGSRLHTTDDIDVFDPGVPFRDTAVEGFESGAAARAFASLPERWQLVLWHTEVEGQKPADVAPLLGMSPNSVSALAYRAREGLRQAFLNEHVSDLDEDTCRWTHEHLGAYIRNGTSRRDSAKVEGHLGECRRCMGIYLELTEVNSNLAAILAPLLLGGAAAAYVGATTATLAPTAGVLALLDRARDFVLANGQASAVAGVAAITVAVGTTLAIVVPGGEPARVADLPVAAGLADPTDERSGSATTPTTVRERSPRTAVAPIPGPPVTGSPTADAAPVDGPTVSPGTGTSTPSDPGPGHSPGQPPSEPGGSPQPTPSPAPDQSPDPSPGPSPDPGPKPDPGPSPDPGPKPDPDPGPKPDPSPDPTPGPPTADLAVTASTGEGQGRLVAVTVTVTGLPAGAEGTLSITSDGVVITGSSLDARCSLVALRQASCSVAGGGPATYRFLAVGVSPGATLRLTVGSDDVADPRPGNNTTTVRVS